MGRILFNSGMQRAQAVLALMQLIVSDETDNQPDIHARTFATETGDGFHFKMDDKYQRANIIGDNRSDGFILNYGFAGDYEFPSGRKKRPECSVRFNYDQAQLAAQAAVNWLLKGIPPSEGSLS